MRPRVLVEATFIGAIMSLMMYAALRLLPKRGDEWRIYVASFACGALFHVACEQTGLNAWYARTYMKYLQKSGDAAKKMGAW